MFPRRFFLGRYFAPVFFPESQGGSPAEPTTGPYYIAALGYHSAGPVALDYFPK